MDEDIIVLNEQFYIRATSSRADERTRVLKQGDTFGVYDRFGDIHSIGLGEQGLFHEGTRYLSRMELRLDPAAHADDPTVAGRGKIRPLLLSSTVSEENDVLAVDLTNPDISASDGTIVLPRGVLHLARTKFIWQGTCYERLTLSNYGMQDIAFSFVIRFDADFVDIFEVRGSRRERRGEKLEPLVEGGSCVLGYQGLDRIVRRTTIDFDPTPVTLTPGIARFDVALAPKQSQPLFVAVSCQSRRAPLRARHHGEAYAAVEAEGQRARKGQASLTTENEQFNRWIERSTADLQMMVTETPQGLYPYAGVPWFSTVFGRDGIITALQMLWLNPQVARGVLGTLAALQADSSDPKKDSEPGKILHETRTGEMANLGEVPFGRYYGSVDSTPLFVMLAGAYYQRTGDRAFMETLWPHLERALTWIETSGDPDGDGFVEYARKTPSGLAQQGWKDSHDSIFHADGTMAEPPIALCEVQGYAYAAWQAAAAVATVLGHAQRAADLRERAARLKERFERYFWSEELGTYAMALDGQKRPCLVRSSNPGHALYSDIASPAHARRVAEILFSDASFSGWGIRTLASNEVRYNPMSYHNGSVWPHDNALAAAGLSQYGMRREPLRLLEGMFLAANFLDLHRLPELFCGFERRPGEGPTLYPVACLPQAWASGSVFMLLQACLGMSIDAPQRVVRFENPALPTWLPEVQIRNLQVADGCADLLIERHPHDVGVTVLRREGRFRVDVIK